MGALVTNVLNMTSNVKSPVYEVQKQPAEVFCKKRYPKKFRKIYRKTPVPTSRFLKSCRPEALAQVFSCQFCLKKNFMFCALNSYNPQLI